MPQSLTQALGKLKAKMTHQEKLNGGKGEDILVSLIHATRLPVIQKQGSCPETALSMYTACRQMHLRGDSLHS